MSILRQQGTAYLAMRRSLGCKLRGHGYLLMKFIGYLEDHGHSTDRMLIHLRAMLRAYAAMTVLCVCDSVLRSCLVMAAGSLVERSLAGQCGGVVNVFAAVLRVSLFAAGGIFSGIGPLTWLQSRARTGVAGRRVAGVCRGCTAGSCGATLTAVAGARAYRGGYCATAGGYGAA